MNEGPVGVDVSKRLKKPSWMEKGNSHLWEGQRWVRCLPCCYGRYVWAQGKQYPLPPCHHWALQTEVALLKHPPAGAMHRQHV